MSKIFLFCLIIGLFTLISSCSYFLPHRIDIQQGNILDQENVNQIQLGMRKDQVQFILGTPMLIDPFHNDRWDYVHTIKLGRGNIAKNRLSLYFKDDELTRIGGDITPGKIVVKETEIDEIVIVPLKTAEQNDDSTWYGWLTSWGDDSSDNTSNSENESSWFSWLNPWSDDKEEVGEPEPNQVNHSVNIPEIIEENRRN